MERFHESYSMETQKFAFINIKHAYLSVFAFMFCKQCLAYATHIDGSAFLCYP